MCGFRVSSWALTTMALRDSGRWCWGVPSARIMTEKKRRRRCFFHQGMNTYGWGQSPAFGSCTPREADLTATVAMILAHAGVTHCCRGGHAVPRAQEKDALHLGRHVLFFGRSGMLPLPPSPPHQPLSAARGGLVSLRTQAEDVLFSDGTGRKQRALFLFCVWCLLPISSSSSPPTPALVRLRIVLARRLDN